MGKLITTKFSHDMKDNKQHNSPKPVETPQLGVFGVVSRFFYNIQHITLVRFEYNVYNGFIFTLLSIEYQGETKGFEGDLIGVHFSRSHLSVYLLFVYFEIKSPFLK